MWNGHCSKCERLKKRVRNLKADLAALQERFRMLEEENAFAGETLARMRLLSQVEIAEARRRLVGLGAIPQKQEASDDKRNT